ncbi:MAG: hypothetical protein CM1200mP18_10700 [Gammaproteobacteria bacterium]|nr:MAG: hypothetical protein CM1200mP18_10700 [Gammaproteobacteria bacterium]
MGCRDITATQPFASPEKGKAMVDAISTNLAKFLKEFATLDVADVNAEVPT